MALYIPHSIFHLVRLLYVRPKTFGPYYVFHLSLHLSTSRNYNKPGAVQKLFYCAVLENNLVKYDVITPQVQLLCYRQKKTLHFWQETYYLRMSFEDKNEWSYTCTPPICLHGVDRDKITFVLFPSTKRKHKKITFCEPFLCFLRQKRTKALIYINTVLLTLLHYFMFQPSRGHPEGALVRFLSKVSK